jgi:hypothetical protein
MMNDRHDPDSDCVARARTLMAKAARGVERMEDVASQAFCRLAALTGMLARLEELATSRDPDAAEAAELDSATVCREAKVLLNYLDSCEWASARRAANESSQARPRARLDSSMTRGDCPRLLPCSDEDKQRRRKSGVATARLEQPGVCNID